MIYVGDSPSKAPLGVCRECCVMYMILEGLECTEVMFDDRRGGDSNVSGVKMGFLE